MRLVPVSAISDDSVLGRSIIDEHGRVLLRRGVKLRRPLLGHLLRLGYTAIYIEDEYSQAQVEEIYKPQLVAETISLARQVVTDLIGVHTLSSRSLARNVQRLAQVVEGLLDDILASSYAVTSLLTISNYDQYTYKHSLNCMVLAVILGKAVGLQRGILRNLAMGAIFHDMGKFFVPKEILLKPEKLTEEEMERMRNHPREGYAYLKRASDLMPTARIVSLEHHERWDGTGYPAEKLQEEAHLHSRILAVCDVYEALTATRPYRPGWSAKEARAYILGAGGSHFDLELVKIFSGLICPYPVDVMVRLTDGREGIVREVNKALPEQPRVEIFVEDGRFVAPYVEDLTKKISACIDGIIHQFSPMRRGG